MQLSFSLDGINKTIKALTDLGVELNKDFKSELVNQGNELRNKAREILAEESASRTGQAFWTGRLSNAIKSEVQTNDVTMTGIRVGVDLREARYAEWVEIGHQTSNPFTGKPTGEWWEGYHFLEGAYLELGPNMSKKITDTLKVTLTHFTNQTGRTRSKATGRFTKGNFSIN